MINDLIIRRPRWMVRSRSQNIYNKLLNNKQARPERTDAVLYPIMKFKSFVQPGPSCTSFSAPFSLLFWGTPFGQNCLKPLGKQRSGARSAPVSSGLGPHFGAKAWGPSKINVSAREARRTFWGFGPPFWRRIPTS